MMRVRELTGRAAMAALGLFAGVAACGEVQVPVVVLGDRPTAVERFAAEELAGEGCNLLAVGEMGIGNTTSAAALAAALLNLPPVMLTVGVGRVGFASTVKVTGSE